MPDARRTIAGNEQRFERVNKVYRSLRIKTRGRQENENSRGQKENQFVASLTTFEIVSKLTVAIQRTVRFAGHLNRHSELERIRSG